VLENRFVDSHSVYKFISLMSVFLDRFGLDLAKVVLTYFYLTDQL
jgi:hypothetical protein